METVHEQTQGNQNTTTNREMNSFYQTAYLVTPLARPTLQARTPLRLLIMLLFPTLGKPEENHINPCKLNKKTQRM